MNKEELEKEADNYAEKHAFRVPYDGSNKFYDDVDFKASKEGYLAGAEPREKRIAELERKLKVETELSNRLGLAYREYEQLTKEQDEHLAELEQENAELKLKLEALEGQTPWKDIKDKSELIKENAELKSENQKWKDEWQEQVQKATDEGYTRTLKTMQLTKAKEIIKAFLDSSDLNIKHKAEEFLGEF